MTLVISCIQRHGIVMVADSAQTTRGDPTRGKPSRVVTAVQKLFPIPSLNAVMSCWGRGVVDDIPMDEWMRQFVDFAEASFRSVPEVAYGLQAKLRGSIPELPADWPPDAIGDIGVHLCGYTDDKPDLWHVHNGASTYFKPENPELVNAHNDWIIAQHSQPDLVIRNGDFKRYTVVDNILKYAAQIWERDYQTKIPANPTDLFQWLEFYKLHIDITWKLLRLSDQPATIAGPILGAVIQGGKIRHFESDGVRDSRF